MAQRKQRAASPPELLRALERDLSEGRLARAYVLRGQERYFQERALGLLRVRAEARGDEICLHDASQPDPDFSLARVIDDLSGGGLFAERRFVVVRNADGPLKKAGSKKSPLTEAVEAFVAAEGDPGTLVLLAASLRADHSVVKAVKKAGGVVLDLRKLWDGAPPWRPDPRQAEIVQWLLGRARELGVSLDPDQAVYVCAATGNDLFALEGQLERIKSLPDEELQRVVRWETATTPWAVAGHFLDGDRKRAAAGLETLFTGGFQEKSGKRKLDVVALSAMLTSSLLGGVRQALAIGLGLERGLAPADAAAAAGVSGRAVEEAVRRARAVPVELWRERLEELLALERRSKSGAGVDVNDFARLLLAWRRNTPRGVRT